MCRFHHRARHFSTRLLIVDAAEIVSSSDVGVVYGIVRVGDTHGFRSSSSGTAPS
jgi:hypothetical protein